MFCKCFVMMPMIRQFLMRLKQNTKKVILLSLNLSHFEVSVDYVDWIVFVNDYMVLWISKNSLSYNQGWENGHIAFVEPVPRWGLHRLASLNCICKWLYVFLNLLYGHGRIPATTPGMSLSSIISRPLKGPCQVWKSFYIL